MWNWIESFILELGLLQFDQLHEQIMSDTIIQQPLVMELLGMLMDKNGVYYEILGKTKENSLDFNNEFSINLSDLSDLNLFWFKNYFNEDY